MNTRYFVRSLWKASLEIRTSGSQCRMMSRLAMTQSPAAQRVPQRGRLRVVFPSSAYVTSSCRGEPQGAIWGGPVPGWGGQIRLILTQQVGEGRQRKLRPPACTFSCLKINFPYSLLFHQGAFFCHSEDWVCSLIQRDARRELGLSCVSLSCNLPVTAFITDWRRSPQRLGGFCFAALWNTDTWQIKGKSWTLDPYR